MGVLWLALAGIFFNGIGAAFLGLGLSVHLFLNSFRGVGDIAALILTAGFIFVCPIVAWVSGAILDSFSLMDVKSKVFRDGLLLGTTAVLTFSEKAFDYLEAFCLLMQNYSVSKALLGFTSLTTAIIFVSFAIAITLMALILIVEITTVWCIGAMRARTLICFSGLRPLLVIVGISLSINLIIGLLGAELWPVNLFGPIGGN